MGRAVGIIPTPKVVPPAAAHAARRPPRPHAAGAAPQAHYRTLSSRRANPARPQRRSSTAFTLFELMIVILIIWIAAAVAVPRYASSVGRYRAEFAAKRVAADLNLARARAKAASSTRNVTFNL